MSATNTNTGLYVDEHTTFIVRRDLEQPVASECELLVETHFSGANPADTKHVNLLGIYPAVLGYDFCGKVLKASTNSRFHPGDLVAGFTPTGIGRPARYRTYQQYLACPEDMVFLVPANLPPHEAACFSVVTMTAADALYNLFRFPHPGDDIQAGHHQGKSAGPLLIWGVSSSVGLCAVQLAKASGIYPIFVTASPSRHALLRGLGATQCFDYKSPNVVSQVNSALRDGQWDSLDYGFDTVGSHGSAKLMAECVSNGATLVSVVLQDDHRFKMPFATPNQNTTIHPKGAPHPITIPARTADYQHAWKALNWAVVSYGRGFRFPAVEVLEGTAEKALDELKVLGDNGRGFGKLVLAHPLQ
ncbi:chaperonin 10-like protein [Aspergillus leporis]|jgi:NADPH:quinone reductase-like Zn-dependent oxidoreductase|uniref:Chaperonin 10-like protein n=1 Tax=Aspergillus leporis TaxID=41062 RepID=A0A5N5WRH8_9EURO|nr:chaperonin 10-like protein [Aspergillus leporis]